MADTKPTTPKKTRTVKPVYAVMNIVGKDGNTLDIAKEDVNVVGIYKDADELLSVLEGAGLPKGSFYKQIKLG